MKATFVEMSTFEKHRAEYLNDTEYQSLQEELLSNPQKGATISGTGGLRKIRWSDPGRNKGKRGGTRIIYYIYDEGDQFWMFLIYDKDQLTDLTSQQKKAFRQALNIEIQARKRS